MVASRYKLATVIQAELGFGNAVCRLLSLPYDPVAQPVPSSESN